MDCFCGRPVFANHRCWDHLQAGVRTMYQLGGRLQEIPLAFRLAFQNYTEENGMNVLFRAPSRATIWLQEMANIQDRLKNPRLSPTKRAVLERQLRTLQRKLDQN